MLGVRRVFGAMLPAIVGAMIFLAALALGGAAGAAALARHWREGAASAMTVQVPRPAATLPDAQGRAVPRRDRVMAVLAATPGITARALRDSDVADLLRPWLGTGAEALSMPLPGVIAVTITGAGVDLPRLSDALWQAAPGTVAEVHDVWVRRLGLLARSLQSCALAALLLVAGLGAAVVVLSTRAALAARREAVEIVHGLGGTDALICGRFAGRVAGLALFGGVVGLVLAVPVLLGLAAVAAPFAPGRAMVPAPAGDPATLLAWLAVLPGAVWAGLGVLPLVACGLGWVTARMTVRAWLRRLP